MQANQKPARDTSSAILRPSFAVLRRSNIGIENRWYRSRKPLTFQNAANAFAVASLPLDALAAAEDGFRYIRIGAGDKAFHLGVPHRFLVMLLQSYGMAVATLPSSRSLLLLLEHRFSVALDTIERRTGKSIVAADIAHRAPDDGDRVRLAASVTVWGETFLVKIWTPPELASAFLDMLDAQPSGALVNGLNVAATAALRVAVTQLTLKTLASIRLNDVVLADVSAGIGNGHFVIGERLSAKARWDNHSLTLIERPAPLAGADKEVWSMSETLSVSAEPDPMDADFNDLQIKVTFEIGRREIPLGDLRRLVPGYIFELNKEPRTAVDIYAGSRRVGHGEIVQVNDMLGVRVTRIFNNE